MHRLDPRNIRAALWALRALARIRRDLDRLGIAGARVLQPPGLPPESVRCVLTVLQRRRATCLERSLVLQKWHSAHGVDRDIILGVTAPGSGFSAHAWLDGETDEGSEFHELRRLAVR